MNNMVSVSARRVANLVLLDTYGQQLEKSLSHFESDKRSFTVAKITARAVKFLLEKEIKDNPDGREICVFTDLQKRKIEVSFADSKDKDGDDVFIRRVVTIRFSYTDKEFDELLKFLELSPEERLLKQIFGKAGMFNEVK